jgi:predicted lipid-binding transport protein (Tim44 family)
MTTEHLSEEAIQWYAETTGQDPAAPGAATPEPGLHDIITHMQTCEACQARVAVYRELFTAIGQQPEASFDFDLAQAVLSQLSPAPAPPSAPWSHSLRWLIPLMGAAAGAPIYFFRGYILEIFAGISSMLIYLAVIVTVSVVIFQGIETYRKYQRKMDALNLY